MISKQYFRSEHLSVPAYLLLFCRGNIPTAPKVSAMKNTNRLFLFTLLFLLQYSAVKASDRDTISVWLSTGAEVAENLRTEGVSDDQVTRELFRFYSEKHLGITYVAGLLDEPRVETLVVTLQGSDCVLFVEHAVAMTMTTMQGTSSYDVFVDNLALLRYGDGVIDGYASRLHYFSDWLQTNARSGRIALLFQQDNLPELQDVYFMSENREAYWQLAENDSLYTLMRIRETELNSLNTLRYIPQERIQEFESLMQTGDILSFVTTIGGLDISHTAIVNKEGDRAGFWHASTTGSVIEDERTIYEYTRNRGNIKGIILARPQF